MPRGRSRCGYRRHSLRITRARDSGRRRGTGTGREGPRIPTGSDRRGPRTRITAFGRDKGGSPERSAGTVERRWHQSAGFRREGGARLGRGVRSRWRSRGSLGSRVPSARAVPGAGCRSPVLGRSSARVLPKARAVLGASPERGAAPGEGLLIPWACNRRRSEWVAAPAGGVRGGWSVVPSGRGSRSSDGTVGVRRKRRRPAPGTASI